MRSRRQLPRIGLAAVRVFAEAFERGMREADVDAARLWFSFPGDDHFAFSFAP
jgi:hypothetical protein